MIKQNHHKLIVTIKAQSNGEDYTESQRRELQNYLLSTTGKYLESQGFHGNVRVERESVFTDIKAKVFG